MNLQIHLDNSFDKEKLIELQSKSLRLLSTDYEPKTIKYLIKSQAEGRLKNKNEIVAVALDKDELIGFACLDINPYSSDFLITGLYVHPNFIRKGIGRNLLNFINKTAQESGCKVIRVYSSVTAADFYKAQGFQVISYSKLIPSYVYLKKELVYEPNLSSKTFSIFHLVIAIILLCSLIGLILKVLHNPAPTTPIQTLPEKSVEKE
jgi:putative acetyltransferase